MPSPPALWLALGAMACACQPLRADDTPPAKATPDTTTDVKPVMVPYRLTDTKHVLVRVKINGKGPFNLIVDTGAPPVLLIKKAAKEAGITPGSDGWAKLQSFEIEGGLKVNDVRTRVTDLPQAIGMNAMGLAGVELHGVVGYEVLARYRITYDFNADQLEFTKLDFKPSLLRGGGKGDSQGSLDAAGPLMKMMAGLLGITPNFATTPRGVLGITLAADDALLIESVLEQGAAEKAGVKPGDRLKSIALQRSSGKFANAQDFDTPRDVARLLNAVQAGQSAQLTVERAGKPLTLRITFAKGI